MQRAISNHYAAIPQTKINQFQQEILSWYEKNIRDLPWREIPFDTSLQQRDPYKILVSEVMSQQTQLSRVIPKYVQWMEELPTVESLASAKQSTVLRLWSGLGYNRRALFLQKAAQMVVHEYNSLWPRDEKELEKLPGIGKYTASAVACFAFDKQIPIVDTNVRKIILLKFFCKSEIRNSKSETGSKSKNVSEFGDLDIVSSFDIRNSNLSDVKPEEIEDIAQQLLPKGKAYMWNQALMDYAALMLRGEKVPVPKQSKFLGSKRFYRGKVLKLLVKHQRLSFEALWKLVKDERAGDEAWFKMILLRLMTEGFIHENKQEYFL